MSAPNAVKTQLGALLDQVWDAAQGSLGANASAHLTVGAQRWKIHLHHDVSTPKAAVGALYLMRLLRKS